MAIPTLKNKHICQVLGTGIAYILEDMLRAGNSTQAIARAMGTSMVRMQQLLDGPDPLPERPLNWGPFAGVGPAGLPWTGAATIAWTGIDGGFTYGPPLFANCVYTTAAYPVQTIASPPRNWIGPNGAAAGPDNTPWAGVARIAYTGPPVEWLYWNTAQPGFTYGPPIYH
jgi:hypothetical protein